MSLLQNRNYYQLLPLLPLLRITFRGNLEMRSQPNFYPFWSLISIGHASGFLNSC
jgi:hypothetical protein